MMRNNRPEPPQNQLVRLTQSLESERTQELISEAVPATLKKLLTPDRMATMAIGVYRSKAPLHRCSIKSIVGCVVDVASMGLEITGGPFTDVYLVPRGTECTVIVSPQGLMKLGRRSGEIENIEADVVREKDRLVLRRGTHAEFTHEPYLGNDPGPVQAAYCFTTLKNGRYLVELMNLKDIKKRQAKSTGGNVWRDWFDEMAIKSVIKKASKMWPKTSELGAMLEAVHRADQDGSNPEPAPMTFDGGTLEPTEAPDKEPALADDVASYGPPADDDNPFTEDEGERTAPEGRD